MKGVIHRKGFRFYTNMRTILEPFEKDVLNYNWLITDVECNHYPDDRIYLNCDYVWLSGKELLNIVRTHDIQFIWGVFSAFRKTLLKDDILKYDYPYADMNKGFWENPISIQHPLAEIEIVPWDSSLCLFIAKDDNLVDRFAQEFPVSKNLEQHNNE